MTIKSTLTAVLSCSLIPLLSPVDLLAETAEQFVAPDSFLEDSSLTPITGVTPDGSLRYEIIGEYAVYQGDMVLGKVTEISKNSNAILLRGLARNSTWDRWIDGLIYYKLGENLDASTELKIAAAIDHWNSRSSISLIEVTPEMESTTRDYINFEASSGCASYVGRNGGSQALWVAPQCTVGSIIHEIGHAAGLFHEHTRSDRDNFVTVQWNNINSDKRLNFDIMDTGVELIGDYDYESIMHYGSTFFSNTGNATLLVPDGITIGQRDALSEGDLASIDQIYGTDLSLNAAQESNENGSIDILVSVSNQGELGAHNIEFTLPLNEGATDISMIPSDWSCGIQSSKVRCELPTIAEQDTSELSLRLAIDTTANLDESYLVSKTFDLDPSNNGAVPPEVTKPKETDIVETDLTETEPEDTETTDTTSENSDTTEPELGAGNPTSTPGGGGALLWLLLLGPIAIRRTRQNRE